MIGLFHKENQVVEVVDLSLKGVIDIPSDKPTKALFKLAENFPDRVLIWCHIDQKENLNIDGFQDIFTLKNMMLSYGKSQYIPEAIGYVEDSPFLKVNKHVKYPTWLMSSDVGAIYASQVLKFKSIIKLDLPFSYALNSMAKLGMSKGLFCYSTPGLLKDVSLIKSREQASTALLFRFVRQHYKWVWICFLYVSLICFENKNVLWSLIRSIFTKKLKFNKYIRLESLAKSIKLPKKTLNVIIPTLARKLYLYNVLRDLKAQTLLPLKVIIVEQNPDENSKSELFFIETETWPFEIVHIFTHTLGVCNARNLALNEVDSDYVYLADDDNEFDKFLLESVVKKMVSFNFDCISMSYLQKNEKEKQLTEVQWNAFGGGSSVVKFSKLKSIHFKEAYEFGYGEDTDFGMQLRNKGVDVIYTPGIKVLHLKAPSGGFRTKFVHPWENRITSPKPSPTVMLSRLNNTTLQQLLGYKLVLFLKYYKSQSLKNPLTYFKTFKKQWRESVLWANKLNQIKQ